MVNRLKILLEVTSVASSTDERVFAGCAKAGAHHSDYGNYRPSHRLYGYEARLRGTEGIIPMRKIWC